MELLLIRHALPVRRELDDGVADPDLAPDGHLQAQLLADYLTPEPIDAVYCSPLKRARQTAAPMSARRGLEPIVNDGVAEYDRNSTWYVPVEELKAAKDPRWLEIMNGGIGGEISPDEFKATVVSAVETIIEANPSRTVAIVCHGGVINSYVGHILGIDRGVGFFYPNYTSIHRVRAARSGERSLLTLNETAHLRGRGLVVGLNG